MLDRQPLEKGGTIVFDKILLVRKENETLIGTPYLERYKAKGKVVDNIKGEKIRVRKFKAKVRYRRQIGFRPQYTKIIIEKIWLDSKAENKEKTPDNNLSNKPQKV